MAVTIYTYRTAIGTDGTLWNTSGTYRLKTGDGFDLWCKVSDTATSAPSAPTASTSSNYFTIGTITTKKSSGNEWIGTIRLSAGTATINTNQTLTIKYGSTTYTCNVRINGTANGFSTNPTLASNYTYDGTDHSPITVWGASKSANLHWAMSTSNTVPPDSGWANALSSFTSVMHNAGTYYLWYKMQSTSTTYNDVPPTLYSTSITVSKKTVSLTWGTTTWTYDKTAHSTTCTVGSLISGDSCTATLTGNSITNAGTTTVTASSLSNSNYGLPAVNETTLTVNAKEVTLTWGTVTWTYDTSSHATTCTAGSLISGDSCTVNLTGNSVGPNVGTATVTASSLSNSNYKLPSSKTATLSITQRAVSLSWGTITWTYDGSTHSTTCTATDLLPQTSCTVTLTGNSVGKNVGTATVTASGLSNSNYKLPTSGTSKTLTINTKEVTLTWGTTSWEYDKTAHGTTCTAGSLVTGDTCTVNLTNNSITNVGSVTVTASSLSNSNYKLPSSKTKNIYITAKTVSLTWGTVTWTYDKATHSTTCTAGGVISGDTCTVTLSNNSVGPDVGTKNVSATALSNSNYQLPAAGLEKIISITAKEVTLTWGTTSWVYNGNTRSTTCTLGGIISGDTCTLTLSGNSVGPHVGSATVTASSLSNSNYKLPSSKTKTISITQATTILTWTSYISSMRVGDTQTVSASTNFGTISYSSSSTSVATVSGAVITAKANGTTTITASVATNTYGDWTAASVTFTLTVACGMKVYFDGQYRDAAVYVYYNNQWKKAIPYIYDGTSWKSC